MDGQYPMKGLCDTWLRLLKDAKEIKKERFQNAADEAMQFYSGSHDFMWDSKYSQAPGGFLEKDAEGSEMLPSFRMTVNKPFEAVALFGPALFFKYPQVNVTAIKTPQLGPEVLGLDPMVPEHVQAYQMAMMREDSIFNVKQSHANIKAHYLNWLQIEANKRAQIRPAITEAIVKGIGYLFIDMHQPQGSRIKYPRSRHVSCDNVLKDPDARYPSDVQWVAEYCCHPVNLVEKQYGLKPGSLKGHYMSRMNQADDKKARDAKSRKDTTETHDLIGYYKIWSKNGIGGRLKRKPGDTTRSDSMNYEIFGDFCYMVVAENVPFLLNLPPEALASEEREEIVQRVQWPIPFWTDDSCSNGWPFAELSFFERPNSVWPMGMFYPCIGELRFVNWCMSFLADKVAASSTDYLVMLKSAGKAIQDQIQTGKSPFKIIELEEILERNIDQLVKFVSAPNFSIDIWKMVAEVMDLIDKRTGLTELIYGLTGTQIRSATEAELRNENVAVRPDEMASQTEDWISTSCLKEMEAAIWMLGREDVEPCLGPLAAQVFEEQILTKDFDTVVRDFSYRIEAGSARKPNKNNRVRQLGELGKNMAPTLQAFAMQGMVDPWNAYISDMAEALDIDPEPYLIKLPEPEEQGPSEEEVELEMKEEEHGQELRHNEELHDVEIKNILERGELEVDIARKKAQASQRNGSTN